MKYINAECRFIDEESEDWLDDPTYWAEDGRRVSINHVFVADWKDDDGQHEAVEKAARDGKRSVVRLECGDDHYHFCNEQFLRKPRKVN